MSDDDRVLGENGPINPDRPLSDIERETRARARKESKSPDASRSMEDQVGQGRTPYNFSAIPPAGDDEPPRSGRLSFGNIMAGVALMTLIGAVWFGSIFVRDLFGLVDRLEGEVAQLNIRLEEERQAAQGRGNAALRSQLRQTVVTLEEIARTGDPDKADQARQLLTVAQGILGEVATNTTPAPTPEPTPAPTAEPTLAPTPEPTAEPTLAPTPEPTAEPTPAPTREFDPLAIPSPETPTIPLFDRTRPTLVPPVTGEPAVDGSPLIADDPVPAPTGLVAP